MTTPELLDRWITAGDLPGGVGWSRAQSCWEATVYFLRERRANLSTPEEVGRFFDVLDCLSLMKNPPADTILELLHPYLEESSSESLRCKAMRTLCWMRHPSAVPALLRCFGTESDEHVTSDLQKALGWLKAREAIPRLVKNARIQKSHWIRTSACQALGRIGGTEAVAHLRELYAHEKNEEVRVEAAIGLARNGETDVFEHLEKTFSGSDPSLARDVADHWLERGDVKTLDRVLLRMMPHPEQWGGWIFTLQSHFPQMPQVDATLLISPMVKFKPRYVRRSLRWLERHRPHLRWDPERKGYVTPHLPMPAVED